MSELSIDYGPFAGDPGDRFSRCWSRDPRRAESERAALDGVKVLIVEDEAVLAMMMEQMLEDFGCEVAAIASRLTAAIAAAETTRADVAVLDMNLAGEPIDRVVDILDRRRIPFVFATGYGRYDLRPAWEDRPVVAKPFRQEQLRAAIVEVLSR